MRKKRKVGHSSSGKCIFGKGQEGEGSWCGQAIFSPLLSSVCGVCCLIETCPASCFPLTYIPGKGGWHLATSIAQHSSACPIPLSLESQGVLRRTKRKVNLQACTATRRVAISLWGKKKSPFFVVFLLITALCNIRKHTGTPKVLLKPASIFFFM